MKKCHPGRRRRSSTSCRKLAWANKCVRKVCSSSVFGVSCRNRIFQGPAFHLPAAMCFYRALRVYPSPVELIVIYEKTVPPPVFQVRFFFLGGGLLTTTTCC